MMDHSVSTSISRRYPDWQRPPWLHRQKPRFTRRRVYLALLFGNINQPTAPLTNADENNSKCVFAAAAKAASAGTDKGNNAARIPAG
jgi:hypothetical protein